MPQHESLQPVPRTAVDDRGRPSFGVYAGELDSVGLARLAGVSRRGPLYRLRHHKSWRWCMIATDRLLIALALLDATYATNAFAFAVDLAARQTLTDRTALGLPLVSVEVGDCPNSGSDARFAAQGLRLGIRREEGRSVFRVRAESRELALDAELETRGAPPALVLIAPVPGGTVNVTQKTAGLAARGTVRVAGESYALEGGWGGCDYTNGLLARRTSWRWAFATGASATGKHLGLNLVAGFNDAGASSENALWIGEQLVPVGRASFGFDARSPLEPWTIRTEDGAVDLTFTPIALHREERNLVIARSHFVQAAGTFAGSVRGPSGRLLVTDLPGVTEDQDVLW